jgi:hypothetical protein
MNTQIRIGHFSPDAPAVNVLVDGDITLENVSFGQISDYLDVESGSLDVSIVPAAGGDSVIAETLTLEDGTDYTVLAIGELADIRPLVLTDDNESVDGETRVRFVHTSPDAPAVDVRVPGGPTLFSGIEFGEFGEYAAVDAGRYDIEVVPAGSEDAVLSLTDIEFTSGETVTVFATGLVGADSLDATLVTDFDAAADAKRAAAGR